MKLFIGNYSFNSNLQLLQDSQLLLIVGVLLVIDITVVSVWVAIDPMSMRTQEFPLEVIQTG